VFDKNWHKIHLSVQVDRAILYIDCQKVATSAIEPPGAIDVNGQVFLAKKDNGETVSVGRVTICIFLLNVHAGDNTTKGILFSPMMVTKFDSLGRSSVPSRQR